MLVVHLSFMWLLLLAAVANGQQCNGICEQGTQLLNGDEEATVDGVVAQCSFYDLQLQMNANISAEDCQTVGQQAQDAGCICGTPYNCSGVCLGQGELLNPLEYFTVSGVDAQCSFFDMQLQQVVIEQRCLDTAAQAQQAGCVCGTPYNCTGVCMGQGELLNPLDYFTVNGVNAQCSFFDMQLQQVVIEQRCVDDASKARAAGCKCSGDDQTSASWSYRLINVAAFVASGTLAMTL